MCVSRRVKATRAVVVITKRAHELEGNPVIYIYIHIYIYIYISRLQGPLLLSLRRAHVMTKKSARVVITKKEPKS